MLHKSLLVISTKFWDLRFHFIQLLFDFQNHGYLFFIKKVVFSIDNSRIFSFLCVLGQHGQWEQFCESLSFKVNKTKTK